MQEPSRTVAFTHKARLESVTRTRLVKGTAVVLLFIFATAALQGNWVSVLVWMSGAAGLWIVWETRRRQRERAERLGELDAMSDADFSRYAADLLRSQGFEVNPNPEFPHPGIDFLLTRSSEQRVCRLYRQQRRIGERVILETLAGMEAQGCQAAMVLANQAFSLGARTLARRENCILIDREALVNLIAQHRQGHRVLAFQRLRETSGRHIHRRK